MAQRVKNPPAMEETWVRSLGQKHPLKKEMATTPVLLPGESLDRGAWWATVHGVMESSTTEGLTHTHTHTHFFFSYCLCVDMSECLCVCVCVCVCVCEALFALN